MPGALVKALKAHVPDTHLLLEGMIDVALIITYT